MPSDERMTRSSFSGHIQPIAVPRPMPLLPHRIWSDEDWERIQLGYCSRDMDEKWDVFTEGSVVFLHRSWTGHGIFQATFAPADEGGWQITAAVVERDRRRYRGDDDEYNCLMLELLISAVVLGEPAQEPRAKLAELTRKAPGRRRVPQMLQLGWRNTVLWVCARIRRSAA
ncbi:hypothetical protein FHS39_002381 [Streptomyces olivoverticillatus]|uniref:Uncharacterized protein n=1 Tax=Streptomyces olivoverticillatus TaxID=66427 RepID=A0A7W7LN73_9ACTN|nr:hypothetical protein [Streptomyces olivoverticillatus]MBB4893350.1 hypothetical protein [Streptomyces olivoverticillatus]